VIINILYSINQLLTCWVFHSRECIDIEQKKCQFQGVITLKLAFGNYRSDMFVYLSELADYMPGGGTKPSPLPITPLGIWI